MPSAPCNTSSQETTVHDLTIACLYRKGCEDARPYHSGDCFWVKCACCSHDLTGLSLACTQAPSLQQHSEV